MRSEQATRSTRVGIQGELGSFSHLCTERFFDVFELVGYQWFDKLLKGLADDEIDYAVCPVENSIAGTIVHTYDQLIKHDNLHICAEYYLPIEHHLIVPQNVMKVGDLKQVYSHPMAIAQCEDFLTKHNLTAVSVNDTAGAVRMIAEQNMPNTAAIASEYAAHRYKLKILQRNIQSDKHNYTRFWLLTKQMAEQWGKPNKLSLVLEAKDEPGSLAKILNLFASANINLTKLESRPVVGKVWRYRFFVDLVSARGAAYIEIILPLLQDSVDNLRILGKYAQGKLNNTK